MRLIDADKLYPDCLTKNGRLAISDSQIANAPTVEEPERPQGKWKSKIIEVKKHYAECLFCGFSFEETYGRILPYFCGACGADLREDDEE